MKTVTLNVKGISQGQWSSFLLELNLMKRAWKPYGVDLQVSAPGLRNIIRWATNAYSKPIRQDS